MAWLPPLLPYYGAKWRLAPKYPAPEHSKIVEPFAGGAGYSLLYPDRDVLLIDRDERTCAVWDFLIHATRADVMALPLVEPGQHLDTLDLDLGRSALIGWWLGPASAGGPAKTMNKWARATWPDVPPKYWGESCRARIAISVEYIKHWRVVHGSYEDAPDVKATWFVDPPYQKDGVHYRHGSSDIDFDVLGDWCRSRTGQTMVCENLGAKWLPFRPMVVQQGAQRRSIEVVWVSP